MSLAPVKTTGASGSAVWQNVIELVQGGLGVDASNLPTTSEPIQAGTPVLITESTRLAKVLKTAVVYENTSSTTVKIAKNHNNSLWAVGDFIGKTAGDKAYAIATITIGTGAFDTLTLGTAIGSLTAGDVLFASSAEGASACALAVSPNGLTYEQTVGVASESVNVVKRGTVYSRRTPGMNSTIKALMPLIVFSESY